VGLVPWSLARPGLTSGFVPEKVAGELDFLAVHIYPEKGKVDDAIETLKGFAIGKPVVIEEMFPLKCSAKEFGRFIDESKKTATGWIGFYWGKTPGKLVLGLLAVELCLFAADRLSLFGLERGFVEVEDGEAGRCIGTAKKAGIKAKGPGQFSVSLGESRHVAISLDQFWAKYIDLQDQSHIAEIPIKEIKYE